MSIRISRTNRDFQVPIQGTTFTLRRITPDQDQRLRNKHTKRGQLNAVLYAVEKLEHAVVGWDTIDVDGEPTGYDKALIQHFPDTLMADLLEAVNEGLDPLAPSSRTTSPPSGESPTGSAPTGV